jgi:hypothetical protein
MLDPYYNLPQCSNSDLSELGRLLNPREFEPDYSESLRFGNLFDCLVTEPDKVNVYKRTVEGIEGDYSIADIKLAQEMKRSFYSDPTCAALMKMAECQKVSIGNVTFEWGSFEFTLETRAKWDIWMPKLGYGCDIKTTTATSQKQFELACEHFSYFRSRVFYMELEKSSKDMLIGVSKVNKKIFKVPITRGDKNFLKGKEEASRLAFDYWYLFSDFGVNSLVI